ncbi:hypothetical protein BC834DRAFT_451765 [Gloeopeniophorella convolvens]|nr:hypothetical protein BC834DRAFT_451765 [Gloeopeniophorella convolvens]
MEPLPSPVGRFRGATLPIEIWEHILKLAVAFPDVMDTYVPDSFPLQYAAYPKNFLPLNDIKRSQRSLYTLVLVCRLWNAICTPMLYQCLVIDGAVPAAAVLKTLEHSQKTAGSFDASEPLGTLTRHMIVALSDYPPHATDAEPMEMSIVRRFGNLGRLARCFPRLQILSISIEIQNTWGLPMPYYGRDFAASVTKICAPSLRKLYFYQSPEVLFSREELLALLASAPNLVAIVGGGGIGHIGCPLSLPHLPKLKYLTVNREAELCDGTRHRANDVPLLDHVHIQPSRSSNLWQHLLAVQGPSLTYVSLDLLVTMDPEDNVDCLRMLGDLCPNLTRLEILISDWNWFPRPDRLPPVEHLGIHVLFSSTKITPMCETLASIQMPSLKVVRFMNPQMGEWLASPFSGNGERAWDPLARCTFRVVDCDGHELGPRGRSSSSS